MNYTKVELEQMNENGAMSLLNIQKLIEDCLVSREILDSCLASRKILREILDGCCETCKFIYLMSGIPSENIADVCLCMREHSINTMPKEIISTFGCKYWEEKKDDNE